MKRMQFNIKLDNFVLLKKEILKAGFKIPNVLSDDFKNSIKFPDMTGRKNCPQSEVHCNISFNCKAEYLPLMHTLINKYGE